MNTREFFIRQFKAERPKFTNVIRAIPNEKLHYKPHERNSSAGMIAWFLVLEIRALLDLVKTGENRWQQTPAPKSIEEIAREYEKTADEMERLLPSVDDAQWERPAPMYFGEKLAFNRPLGETLWDFFFDAIHHRGQLTAYLRPMGGKVPSIYGPTADSK
jgi:uncharacterized damage-inducible protein DinB